MISLRLKFLGPQVLSQGVISNLLSVSKRKHAIGANVALQAHTFFKSPMIHHYLFLYTCLASRITSPTEQRNSFSSSCEMASTTEEEIEATCREDTYKLLPILKKTSHKGQAGRVGIIGGSIEFSGAPYFAGMSALRSGADLVYIFTAENAAPVIKSYSPDLMVLPFLDKPTNLSAPFLTRLHTLVIGPGLGRNETIQKSVFNIIDELNNLKGTASIPLIIDADGIQLLLKKPDLFKSYMGKIYVTPNVNEFKLLYTFFKGSQALVDNICFDHVKILAERLGNNFTIVLKGPSDIIVNGNLHVRCSEEGGLKRCGGQGDLLSGVLGAVSYWAFINDFPPEENHCVPEMLAGYIACTVVRKSSNKTFKTLGRSMEASDILTNLPSVFKDIYGKAW